MAKKISMGVERITTATARELLTRGNAGLLRTPAVGIVGSRKASIKGVGAAQDCAWQLAKLGVTVVSGYANGVDLASHKAALDAGGATILVLAEGIERFRVKRDIETAWDWERALVVSEYPPNAAWSVKQAMQRNGTICELSRAVIVAEAQRISGTMNTVRQCLKKEIPLFVVTYENMEDLAGGNALAIELGGRPLYKGRISQRAKIDPILELLEARVAA
jgi:DNA processing protein